MRLCAGGLNEGNNTAQPETVDEEGPVYHTQTIASTCNPATRTISTGKNPN